MNDILDLILHGLEFAYGERWVAPFVLLPVMFVLAAIVRQRAIKRTRPYLAAVRARTDKVREALGSDNDPTVERKSFGENYIDVSRVMGEDVPGAHGLVLAWREFQETMVDENDVPVRNTNRPGVFFSRVAPKQTMLTFASNIFVGAGLILTFLGLIVALNTAAQGMAGDDVNVAKQSLQNLLIVAGSKFFTSVAGLGASIWLRFVEHNLTIKVRRETDLLCELLERGLLYVSPQKLAVEQLDVLREQRDQLKFFNTDVAMQLSDRIGAQFTQAIAPVAASINALNDSMASVTQGIGAGAQKAIEEATGEQLHSLSETLAGLSSQLGAIGATVGNSNDEAARQIRLAGEDFTTAAADIREAFRQLAGQVDGLGTRFNEQGEAVSAAQREALASLIAGIEDAQARSATMVTEAVSSLKSAGAEAAGALQTQVRNALEDSVKSSQQSFRTAIEESSVAFERLAGQVDGVGARLNDQGETVSAAQREALASLMAGMEQAQGRSVAMVTEVVAALKAAGVDAANVLQTQVRGALDDSVRASQETFRVAIQESGQALRETTDKLSKAVGEAAQQVERAGTGFAQSGEKAIQTAEAMRSVTDNVRSAATSLGNAAQGFASAADPVAQAAQSVNQAAKQLAQTVAADRAADTVAIAQMTSLAEGVRATQDAAAQAWNEYRARFESVDRALAAATEKLAETLGDSLTEFRKFAQDTDREMASAVSRLGNTLTQLEDYAGSLDDYVEESRGLREAAE